MDLSPRLDLRQTTGLVLTPQLQQAIKLLQYSNLQLERFVAQEVSENPFLETADDTGEAGAAEPSPGVSGPDDDGWQQPPPAPAADMQLNGTRGGSHDSTRDAPDIAQLLTRPKTLRDHLTEQLHIDVPGHRERLIGHQLIEAVDERGYLADDTAAIAERLGCPEVEVEAVLAGMQHFDPPGVLARSVAECLALQLRERDRLDPAMQALLDHLELLARADMRALMKVCGVDEEDLADMIAEIRQLDPKPGLGFAGDEVSTAIPDVIVQRAADGWRVELNDATLPRVLVNRSYHASLRANADSDEKAYLAERLQAASWLTKALDQRAQTLLRVARSVVERQIGFLEEGVHRLQPLVLREIAEETGLHESTVSRATAGKWVATPRGTVPFRYFFSIALPSSSGDGSHSAEAIRQRIRTMIEHEDPKRVLSDDAIAAALKTDGIAVARRTVAKYRESLKIPSSAARRRSKALGLA